MFRLLESIFGERRRRDAVVDEQIVTRALERLVEGTDRRLRTVPRYRAALRPAVESSVAYVIGLVEALPSPVALSPRAYREDPRLRAKLQEVAVDILVKLKVFLILRNLPQPYRRCLLRRLFLDR